MWAIAASPMLVTTPIMTCTDEDDDASMSSAAGKYVDTEESGRSVAQARAAAADAPCTISLVKQLDKTVKCVEGESFGCYGTQSNKTMWIGAKSGSRGCRGIFDCDGVKNVRCDPTACSRRPCLVILAANFEKDNMPVALKFMHNSLGCVLPDGALCCRCDTMTPSGGDPHHVCSCDSSPPPPPHRPRPAPAPTPSPECPECPDNPPKGKCKGALTDVQKTILLNTEVIAISARSTSLPRIIVF